MIKKTDVVIIGGGVNGCSLAYNLAKRGIDVTLFEKKYLSSGATGACGAGIRQQWSTRENALLAIESVKIFEKLSRELGEDIEFRQGGYLIMVHDEEEMKQAEKNVSMQRSLGLKVDILEPDEINDIVPILDVKGINAVGATFCPSDGHANPFKTTFAYANAARKLGAKLYTHTTVNKIRVKDGTVVGVSTDKGFIKTSVVVNAAGVWSRDIARLTGVKLPNVPFRKEIMATERFKLLFEAMVISFKDGIYFSQQREGQIVGGIPIPGEKSGYKTMPTFAFLQHMAKTLTRYAPVLKHVNMLRHWTGFYDVTPDARPILGETPGIKGFIQCNGFSGHGFMISPMVTKILTEYIVDGRTSDILEKLSLNRFKGKKIDREMSVVG
ncbi:MAG: FAD-binding oxidoreductase [Thermoplasmata archaeon]|nr:MAG: FAD-binding oxidoreductase [Thermoplasmata archaeon]RLF30706.1 MAG: FAD-binding oxidoreductase [Thermoplasmata archaeon]RLF36676.1 MAG: FAD-binding oxidoreductase [Thermoplasmata archaeon]